MTRVRAALARTTAIVGIAAGSLCAGCFTTRADSLRQFQDPKTAATITVGAQMLVLARERPELAVHARDYLTLVPLDVNRSGAHQSLVLIYDWSTVESAPGARHPPADSYAIVADGREIALEPVAGDPRDTGLSKTPVEPPSRHAKAVYAKVTREELAYLIGTQELRAVRIVAGDRAPYQIWRDDRSSIEAFLAELPPATR